MPSRAQRPALAVDLGGVVFLPAHDGDPWVHLTPLVDYLRAMAATTTVAAVSNNWSFLDCLLARHGIADLFTVVINSADVGWCKPAPEIFRVMLERLRRPPEEVRVSRR